MGRDVRESREVAVSGLELERALRDSSFQIVKARMLSMATEVLSASASRSSRSASVATRSLAQ
jgi:hypothetical protein